LHHEIGVDGKLKLTKCAPISDRLAIGFFALAVSPSATSWAEAVQVVDFDARLRKLGEAASSERPQARKAAGG